MKNQPTSYWFRRQVMVNSEILCVEFGFIKPSLVRRQRSTVNATVISIRFTDKWLRYVSTGPVNDDLSRFLRDRSAKHLPLVPPNDSYTTKTMVIIVTAMQTGSWCRPEIRRHRDYNVLVRAMTEVIIVSGHRQGGGRCDWSQGRYLRQTRGANATTDQADIPMLLRSSVVRACGSKNILILFNYL